MRRTRDGKVAGSSLQGQLSVLTLTELSDPLPLNKNKTKPNDINQQKTNKNNDQSNSKHFCQTSVRYPKFTELLTSKRNPLMVCRYFSFFPEQRGVIRFPLVMTLLSPNSSLKNDRHLVMSQTNRQSRARTPRCAKQWAITVVARIPEVLPLLVVQVFCFLP